MSGEPDVEMVALYKGKRLEEMTREELMEAVRDLGRLNMGMHEAARQRSKFSRDLLSRRA